MGIVLRVAAAVLQWGSAHAALHCRAQNLLAAAAAVSTQITAAFCSCIVAAGVPRPVPGILTICLRLIRSLYSTQRYYEKYVRNVLLFNLASHETNAQFPCNRRRWDTGEKLSQYWGKTTRNIVLSWVTTILSCPLESSHCIAAVHAWAGKIQRFG